MAIIPTDKKQQNLLTIGIFALVLAFGFYFFRYKKVSARIATMQMNIDSIEAKKKNLEGLKKIYANLPEKVKLYEQHMKRMEDFIPRRADVPSLLSSLADQAQVANIAYRGIDPQLKEQVSYYSREVYDVTVNGTYHDIGAYLAGIASLPRIIKTKDMRVSVDAAAKPRADGSPTLKAVFSIETYVIPAPGEVMDSTKKGG